MYRVRRKGGFVAHIDDFRAFNPNGGSAEIFKWLQKAAELGSADAAWILGECYRAGYITPQDAAQAAAWYRKAAEQGHGKAQYKLGLCLATGQGVTVDHPQALEWYRKAAEQRLEEARLAAYWCFATAAGVPQEDTAAVEWYRRVAARGDAIAQNNLAGCYVLGRGVGPDHEEAVQLCRKAAEQGLVEAWCNLGLCYATGHGVPQEALKWAEKAAAGAGGDVECSPDLFSDLAPAWERSEEECIIGFLSDLGWPAMRDCREAVKWYRKAADQGMAAAQLSLGRVYEEWDGGDVGADYQRALTWYCKAADQGEAGAERAATSLLKTMEEFSVGSYTGEGARQWLRGEGAAFIKRWWRRIKVRSAAVERYDESAGVVRSNRYSITYERGWGSALDLVRSATFGEDSIRGIQIENRRRLWGADRKITISLSTPPYRIELTYLPPFSGNVFSLTHREQLELSV